MHDFFGQSAPLAELGGALAELLVERDEGRIVLVDRLHLLDRHDDGAEIAFGGRVLERGRALLALEQQLNAAKAALDLADARDDAHRVEDVRRRLVGVVALRDGEDEPLALERRLDGAKRSRPAGGDRRGQARKDDGPPQRENGKCLASCHVRSRSERATLRTVRRWRESHTPFHRPAGVSNRCGARTYDARGSVAPSRSAYRALAKRVTLAAFARRTICSYARDCLSGVRPCILSGSFAVC